MHPGACALRRNRPGAAALRLKTNPTPLHHSHSLPSDLGIVAQGSRGELAYGHSLRSPLTPRAKHSAKEGKV
jgi:hypothetical protein